MNKLRTVLQLLLALMLATFAVSSIAASGNKSFYAQVLQPVIPLTPITTTLSITVFNDSPPPGLSTANWVQFVAAKKPDGTPLFTFTGAIGPDGSVLFLSADHTVIEGHAFAGITRGQHKQFNLGVTLNVSTCSAGTIGVRVKAGDSGNGDEFLPDTPLMKMGVSIGCEFTGTAICPATIDASVNGATAGEPGYAKVFVDKLKDATACPAAGIPYTIQNSLASDNKLVVLLDNPKAAFTAEIVSSPKVVNPTTLYASEQVKIAYFKDTAGNWIYVTALTCLCPDALLVCMPTDTVHPAPYLNLKAQVCASHYGWFNDGFNSSGQAVVIYNATLQGATGDPAMGWE